VTIERKIVIGLEDIKAVLVVATRRIVRLLVGELIPCEALFRQLETWASLKRSKAFMLADC
jgi:hypothetical protein